MRRAWRFFNEAKNSCTLEAISFKEALKDSWEIAKRKVKDAEEFSEAFNKSEYLYLLGMSINEVAAETTKILSGLLIERTGLKDKQILKENLLKTRIVKTIRNYKLSFGKVNNGFNFDKLGPLPEDM